MARRLYKLEKKRKQVGVTGVVSTGYMVKINK